MACRLWQTLFRLATANRILTGGTQLSFGHRTRRRDPRPLLMSQGCRGALRWEAPGVRYSRESTRPFVDCSLPSAKTAQPVPNHWTPTCPKIGARGNNWVPRERHLTWWDGKKEEERTQQQDGSGRNTKFGATLRSPHSLHLHSWGTSENTYLSTGNKAPWCTDSRVQQTQAQTLLPPLRSWVTLGKVV